LLDGDPGKATVLQNAIIMSGMAAHYQKSVTFGEKLAALGPIDYKTEGTLAIAYFDLHDHVHAKEFAQKAIDGAKAAGEQPEASWLSVMVNSQMKSNDTAGAEASMVQLAITSGSPKDWANLIGYAISNWKPRDIDALNLMRLAALTNASMDPGDYSMMATIALRKGYPGDAVTASRHGGRAAGASEKAAADQRDLARQVASSKAQGGEYNLQLAQDLYGYGRYTESEASARAAIAKGHAKDPSQPDMVLGMALVGQGRYTDAAQAFQQVSGGPGATKTARLWLSYAQAKASPASAAAH
jgi:hypothetical protein